MADITSMMSGMLPSGSTLMNIMYVIGGGILLAILVCGVVWWVMDRKKYNKIVKLHRKINGKICFIANYRACFEKLGLAGDVWCRIKGIKIIARPKIEYGRDVYLMFEREDGEWINFGIEDIDDKMHKANVFYLDEDMRLHRIGIQKNLQDRLQKATFWEKYGAWIGLAVFMLLITICLIVLFNKLTEVATALQQTAVSIGEMANAMGNVQVQTGSGVVPVTTGGIPV